MFRTINLMTASCAVAAGGFGWWFIPVAFVAGWVADELCRDGEDD
jgi:biotin transporter BioY